MTKKQTSLQSQSQTNSINLFKDVIKNEPHVAQLNQSANEYLNKLKQFLSENLKVTQKFSLKWIPGGIDPLTHEQYLNEFAQSFTTNCIESIKQFHEKLQNVNRLNISITKLSTAVNTKSHSARSTFGKITNVQIDIEGLFKEVLHHSKFCKYKTKLYVEREDLFDKIKAYFKSKHRNKPLCIHTESGGGKTSIMAMIANKLANGQLNDSFLQLNNATVVVRFLGTSGASCDIAELIKSVCNQVEIVYNEVELKNKQNTTATNQQKQTVQQYQYEKNLHDLVKIISDRISNAARTTPPVGDVTAQRRPLIILFDSIDQLNNQDGSFGLKWLPLKLPPHVYIIFSCISNYENILTTYKKGLDDTYENAYDEICDSCIIELTNINEKFCENMIHTYLGSKNRTLNKTQFNKLIQIFMNTQSTLYMKLMLDRAAKWHSFEDILIVTSIIKTQEDAILSLFKELELKYGEDVVSYSLGYLTVSLNGLSDLEMEDLLSCNDVVLNSVYEYHDPPVKGFVHIPSLLWPRIKYDLSEYLVEKQVHNKILNYWYHRKFREVAFRHYCSNHERYIELNDHLSQIYTFEEQLHRTIRLEKRSNMLIENANRLITVQLTVPKNLRKLDVMGVYFINAKNFESLLKYCLCNLKFLSCLLVSFDYSKLQSLLVLLHKSQELRQTESPLDTIDDAATPNRERKNELLKQIEIISNFLIFNEKPLRIDPYQLVPLIIGQLNIDNSTTTSSSVEFKNENIHQLLSDAEKSYQSVNDHNFEFVKKFSLKPLNNCLPNVNGPIKWYYDGFNRILCASKALNCLFALKLSSTPRLGPTGRAIEVIGYGKHQAIFVVYLNEHKVSQLNINPQLSLMDCSSLELNENRNILFVLYETILTIYNIEKLCQICDVDISWNQSMLLNQTFSIFENEKFFCLGNHERVMIHVWSLSTEKHVNQLPKRSNLKNSNAIHKEIMNDKVDWNVRSVKFPNKNPNRSQIVILQYDIVNGEQSEKQEIIAVVSKENDTMCELNVFQAWKEGLKVQKTIQIPSTAYSKKCVLKYGENKLAIGLSNGYVEVYDIKQIELACKIKLSSDCIMSLKPINNNILVAGTISNILYFVNPESGHILDMFEINHEYNTHAPQTWDISDDAAFIAFTPSSIGFLSIYKRIESGRAFNYLKVCSFHISVEPITNFLFTNDFEFAFGDLTKKYLVVTSEDFVLSYLDLDIVSRQRAAVANHTDIKYTSVFFGKHRFVVVYDVHRHILEYGSISRPIVLAKCLSLKFGLFFGTHDAYFIGYSTVRDTNCIVVWQCSTGDIVNEIFLNLPKNEFLLSVCMSDDQSFMYAISQTRQIVFKITDEKRIDAMHVVELANTPIKASLSKIDGKDFTIKTYFTKTNSTVVLQIPVFDENAQATPLNFLCAYFVDQNLFTNICGDATQKLLINEKLKIFNSFCLNDVNILTLTKSSLLKWSVIAGDGNGKPTANYCSVPNFLTFLKHSIRLYDDYPHMFDLKLIELSVAACNSDGSIICTADHYGYLIFWFCRKEKLSDSVHSVAVHEGLNYGYAVVKEHFSEINCLLITGDEKLFSASLDRTVKLWDCVTATCLCTVYTHLIVSQIHYDPTNELLICMASRLGSQRMLTFQLISFDKTVLVAEN